MRPDHTMPAAYWTPVAGLQKWSKNPRRNERAVPQVARSIRCYGFVAPIVVWTSKDRLVAGHTRLLAMEKILAETPEFVPRDAPGPGLVPVRFHEFTDEAEANAYAIADNRLTEIAEWDEESLGQIFAELRLADERLLAETGFGAAEIERFIRQTGAFDTVAADPGPELDRADELQNKWQTAPGQLWDIPSQTLKGRAHRLLCGDSTRSGDVTRLFAGERAELCATDPPYLVDYDGTNHPQSYERLEAGINGNKKWDAYHDPQSSVEFYSSFLQVAIEHALVENPAFYQWHASRRQALVEEAWSANDLLFHQQIIWVKSRAILTRSHFMWQHEPCFYGWLNGRPPKGRPPVSGEHTSVWMIDQKGEQDGVHPTQKPVEIFARPIAYHTHLGDICYEPFSGSGSQLVAAEQAGRRCFAIELEPVFVAVALERLAGMGLQPRQG